MPYMAMPDFASLAGAVGNRPRSSEICRDFNNRGGYCPRGHNCPFHHVFETHDPRFTYPFLADPYMAETMMRKKKPCRDYNSPNGCPRGPSCRYPHVKDRDSKRRKFVDVSAGEKVDEVCKDYNNFNGVCPRGDSCPFQHIKEDKPDGTVSRVCRNFSRDGYCPRGDRCAFIHERGPGGLPSNESDSIPPLRNSASSLPSKDEYAPNDLAATNKSLQAANTALREENTTLREEIVLLRKENIALRKENADFRRKLKGENDIDEIDEFKEQGDKKRKRDSDDEVL